jgi:heat shock protein HslJ
MAARQEVWCLKTVLSSLALVLALAVTQFGAAFTDAKGLEGIEWRLIVVAGAPAATAAGNNQPSILFDQAQKKVSGYTGCNDFFGTYELDGASLKFGPIASTRRACPDPETAVETALLKALSETRGGKIKEGMLVLFAGGEILARFIPGRGDEATADPGSMTYRSKSFPSGTVTLSGGAYRMPAVPGSASEIMVKLSDKKAFGTVNGEEAGAVVLVTSLGGSGTFYDLALLSRGAKGWENTDTVLLGDRVKVHSLKIENDHIAVAMTTHGPNDPLCCPTQQETKRFAVQHDRLVPVAEEKRGGEPKITGTVWQWVQTLYNNDTRTVPAKPENYTIRFLESKTIAVKADCNQKGGAYSTEGKKLSITITHSTMAACEPGSLEDTFVRDLEAGAVFFFKDNDLYIDLKYDSGTMRFSRETKK